MCVCMYGGVVCIFSRIFFFRNPQCLHQWIFSSNMILFSLSLSLSYSLTLLFICLATPLENVICVYVCAFEEEEKNRDWKYLLMV
jgi:hypothetical protein